MAYDDKYMKKMAAMIDTQEVDAEGNTTWPLVAAAKAHVKANPTARRSVGNRLLWLRDNKRLCPYDADTPPGTDPNDPRKMMGTAMMLSLAIEMVTKEEREEREERQQRQAETTWAAAEGPERDERARAHAREVRRGLALMTKAPGEALSQAEQQGIDQEVENQFEGKGASTKAPALSTETFFNMFNGVRCLDRIYPDMGDMDPRDAFMKYPELRPQPGVSIKQYLRNIERVNGIKEGELLCDEDRVLDKKLRQAFNSSYVNGHRATTGPSRGSAKPSSKSSGPTGPVELSAGALEKLERFNAKASAEHRAALDAQALVRFARAAEKATQKETPLSKPGPSGPVREGQPTPAPEDQVAAAKRTTRKQLARDARAKAVAEKRKQEEEQAAIEAAREHALEVAKAIQAGK